MLDQAWVPRMCRSCSEALDDWTWLGKEELLRVAGGTSARETSAPGGSQGDGGIFLKGALVWCVGEGRLASMGFFLSGGRGHCTLPRETDSWTRACLQVVLLAIYNKRV